MIWLLVGLAFAALIAGPGWWVRRTMRKYSKPADRYSGQGTGAELARHLLDRNGLQRVGVEQTPAGDHYDSDAQMVRLSADNFNGHSLTAITVATHEVGHALQHARSESLFGLRQRLVRVAVKGERVGGLMLMAAPFVALVTRSPAAGLGLLVIAIGTMALTTLVHLVTLPVELDASFGKALPMLREGSYLHDGDMPHARRILKAAALTYVAGSLASLLNLGRWLAVLRR